MFLQLTDRPLCVGLLLWLQAFYLAELGGFFLPMYSITGWSENYETSDSRKTAGPMDWYKARTRMNGIKFAMMMREKDASSLFGCWHIFLSIAAAQKKEHRGNLTSGGKALTAQDIELMTRISATVIQRALDFFSSEDIGWMQVVNVSGSFQKFPEISGDFQKSPEVSGSFPTRIEENRREEKRDIVTGKPSNSRFVKPTEEEVLAYSTESKHFIDAAKFVSYYESNGWRVGRNPMKDWKAAVRTWAAQSPNYQRGQVKPEPQNVIRPNLNAPMPKTTMELMLEAQEAGQ